MNNEYDAVISRVTHGSEQDTGESGNNDRDLPPIRPGKQQRDDTVRRAQADVQKNVYDLKKRLSWKCCKQGAVD